MRQVRFDTQKIAIHPSPGGCCPTNGTGDMQPVVGGRPLDGETSRAGLIAIDAPTGLIVSKPANAPSGSDDSKPAKAPPGSGGRISDCERYRELIVEKLALGLSGVRIHQDLVADHAAQVSYYSVKRFCQRLNVSTPPPVRRMARAPRLNLPSPPEASGTLLRNQEPRFVRLVVQFLLQLPSKILGYFREFIVHDGKLIAQMALKIRFDLTTLGIDHRVRK